MRKPFDELQNPGSQQAAAPTGEAPGQSLYVTPEIKHLLEEDFQPPNDQAAPPPPPPLRANRNHQPEEPVKTDRPNPHKETSDQKASDSQAEIGNPDLKPFYSDYMALVGRLKKLDGDERLKAASRAVVMPIVQQLALNPFLDGMSRLRIANELFDLVPERVTQCVETLLNRGVFYQMTGTKDFFRPDMFLTVLRPVLRERYEVNDPETNLILDQALCFLSRSFEREPIYDGLGQLLVRNPYAATQSPSQKPGNDFQQFLRLVNILQEKKATRPLRRGLATQPKTASSPADLQSFCSSYCEEVSQPPAPSPVSKSSSQELVRHDPIEQRKPA